MMLRLRFGRRSSAVKHICRECESRRALFRFQGIVKWDRYHTLCFQCYRRHLDRLRASSLAAEKPAQAPISIANRAAVA